MGFLQVAATLGAQEDFGCARAGSPLHASAIATVLATAFQHATSLFAHTFTCVSARASRVVWYVDYAGILLNFLWNAPALAIILQPSIAGWWPIWLWANLLATAALLAAS